MSSNLPPKLLICDTDRSLHQRLAPELEKYNIKAAAAADLSTAIYLSTQERFDVVLISLEFEEVNGATLLQKIRGIDKPGRKNTAAIIGVGSNGIDGPNLNLLNELSIFYQIEKPIQTIKLLPMLSTAWAAKRSADSLEDLRILSYNVLEKTGDLNKAINSIENSQNVEPQDKLVAKIDLYEQAEAYQQALDLTEQFLAKNGNNVQMVNKKAALHLKLGDLDNAKQAFEKADSLAPRNLKRVEAMSKLYLSTKEPDKSSDMMKQLIELNPDLADLRFDLFDDLDKAGFQEHAVKLCKDVKTSPKDVIRFYNNKGVLNSKAGEAEQALNNYYSAIMYYPSFKENHKVLYNIAIAEARKKTPEANEQSMKALKKCLELKPDFDKARELLAIIEKRGQSIPKAS
jgi:tetratricopeptide (TPR) repeat protein